MEHSVSNDTIPRCRIELFSGLRVKIGGRNLHVPRERRAADLLAYLAYYPHLQHPRERLQDMLWPDVISKENLNLAVSRLGKCLEPGGSVRNGVYLHSDRSIVTLNASCIDTDIADLEESLKSARHGDSEHKIRCLTRAMLLYRGELLPEFYDEWIDQERRRWEEASIRTLKALVQLHSEKHQYEQALEFARRLVNSNSLDEQSQLCLLMLHVLTGRIDVALRHAGDIQSLFQREGLPLSSKVQKVIQQIQHRASGEQQLTPDLKTLIEMVESDASNPSKLVRSRQLEPTGGAIPLDSEYYIQRPTDTAFAQAIARHDSIVVVKGPHQTGKTSLLSRGLHHARQLNASVVYTDFKLFSETLLESADTFLDTLAEAIREQLNLPEPAERPLLADPNSRFERFLRREVLNNLPNSLVWGMDSVDRLFLCPYGESIFALMRSWHESRSLLPDGPWHKLTLVISVATEPYLYIRNLNQSPFNVGTRLELDDFTLEEVAELNRQYASPIRSDEELVQLHELLGGHPFLTHQGLHEMRRAGTTLTELIERADDTAWIFGPHLRTLFGLLEADPEMAETVRQVCSGGESPTRDRFDRLRSAGVLRGMAADEAHPRCSLYARYLLPRLKERFLAERV